MAGIPYKLPRLATLALTTAFGVIGGSVCINAIVKRNQAVAALKAQVAPLGITLTVDTFDLLRPGIVLAVGCALVALVAFASLGLLVLDMFRGRKTSNLTSAGSSLPISTRTLKWQWMALGFLTVWILACNIACTYIAVNNEAKTVAYLGSTRLSQALVEARERQLGVNPAYWSNDYVRLQVIPPWATFLFSLLATIVTYLAVGRKDALKATHGEIESEPEATSPTDAEKPTEAKQETV
ncbi:hypothetical protein CPB86DRAFT_790107 [Serendipita vermifera]|nr:hypothetical protein CPB86DRAFT_790107 [Serendipita vermifera]